MLKRPNSPCPVCDTPVCAVCHGHCFVASEKAIAESDRLHGNQKKQGCACATSRRKAGRIKTVYYSKKAGR